ncbi:MAG: enoyl-CoA hydratase/isomerase family protein [Alphaproteobacteria bacterium]|nr:enoyl-CoA hydratase/isomerase family protein [Rhodospirillales bacterium]MCW9044694.1 enoyl-CoA hydratase/isomerase family protein [Alphaproteobacteria bacterium]
MIEMNTLTYDVSDNVGIITFNRPDNANALNLEMGLELHEAAIQAENDPEVRAVVVTATGKMFCAGGDLAEFHAKGEEMSAHLCKTATGLHNAISRLNWMDAPVIMAINGTAAGAGFSLACGGDMAIAAEGAKFTMAYTAAGLVPDGSSTFFLSKHVGLRRAKELVLTNRVLTAQEALDWGILNKVVPAEDLMDEALGLARNFAKGPTKSFGVAKRLVLSGYTETLETQMDAETRAISAAATRADGKEGVDAFLNKRKPEFKGE